MAAELPSFIYGTAWKEDRTEALVRDALEVGFRAIDTANQRKHYVEAGVGKAVQAALGLGELTRGDLFLQTKFTFRRGQDHRLPYDPEASVAEQVSQSFESSLAHLGVDRIDSYVLHGPSTGRGLAAADREAWAAMETLHRDGRTQHLGISNVSNAQLEALLELATITPTFVQNRCYARKGWDAAVRRRCENAGITYQGFSLLTANGKTAEHPEVVSIADRRGVTVPQVVFAFARAVGMLPLTGTSDRDHMRQDLAALDLELTPEEVATVERAEL